MIDLSVANRLWIVLIGALLRMHGRSSGCGMHGGHDHRQLCESQTDRTQHRGYCMHGGQAEAQPQEQPAPQSNGPRPPRTGAATAVELEPRLFVEDR